MRHFIVSYDYFSKCKTIKGKGQASFSLKNNTYPYRGDLLGFLNKGIPSSNGEDFDIVISNIIELDKIDYESFIGENLPEQPEQEYRFMFYGGNWYIIPLNTTARFSSDRKSMDDVDMRIKYSDYFVSNIENYFFMKPNTDDDLPF